MFSLFQVEVLRAEIDRLGQLCSAHVAELCAFREQESTKQAPQAKTIVYLTSEYLAACREYEGTLSSLRTQLNLLQTSMSTVTTYQETLKTVCLSCALVVSLASPFHRGGCVVWEAKTLALNPKP